MAREVNASYARDDHAFREKDPYAKAKYDLTLRWLRGRVRPGDLLYNVGVGSGYFSHLAAAEGLRVVGCEPDPLAFAAAKSSAPVDSELYNCGLEDFACGREPARFVVMHDVLEHIADDAAASVALRSILASGGTAVLSVPALMSLFGRHDQELGHYRRYSSRGLRTVLEQHFEVEKLQWYGMASIPIVWYFSRWKRLPYPTSTTQTLVGAVYAALCQAETYLAEPIGTSIVARLTTRG